MAGVSSAHAAVWGTEPTLGFAGDYASNPALLSSFTAESHGAVLLDAPTTYNADAWTLLLDPSVRISNSQGYSTIDSDYEHLTAKTEFDTERTKLVFTGFEGQDSSLYRDYLSDGAEGVRRDTTTADLNWDHFATERIELNVDTNAMRVLYGQPTGPSLLTDYKYASFSPTLAWLEHELGKFSFALNGGYYASIDQPTRSASATAQIGYTRQIDPLWTVSGTGGYSRAFDHAQVEVPEPVFLPGFIGIEYVAHKLESIQNSTVFSVNVSRQGSLLLMTLAAARQLIPTGFAYLSRQTAASLTSSYQLSPRWTFGTSVTWTKYETPRLQNESGNSYTAGYFSLLTTWQWTEHWTITGTASRVIERPRDVSSNNFTILISRKFNRIVF